MVDVVRELFLDADFLLLFVQRQRMFAVAVSRGALQTGVQPDDMARYVAQLVVRKDRLLVDPLAPFGTLGEISQPRDVVSQPAGREVGRHAHQQRDAQHEPQKFAVCGQHFAERYRIGHSRADDDPAVGHGRIEIVEVGALRMAADRESRAAGEGFGDFGAVEVVGFRKAAGRIVEGDAPGVVDHRHAQVAERFVACGDELLRRRAVGEGVEHPQVEKLQLRVEPFGLELLFAAVLKDDEAGDQRPRKREQQQEEPPVVGEATPQTRTHSPDVLRCDLRRRRFCVAAA